MNNIFTKRILSRIHSSLNSDLDAFCINGRIYSYSEFFTYVQYVQDRVNKQTDSNDKLIGLICDDTIMTYASIVALWYEGKAYLPLHPKQPNERHYEIIRESKISCVLSEGKYYDGVNTIILNENEVGIDINNNIIIKEVCDSELAYVLFTSGSTGKPKGVQITRKNVSAFIDSMLDYGFDLSSEDKYLQPFDLTFDISVFALLMPLINGGCLYTIPLDATKFTYIAELLEKYYLTFLPVVPSMIRNLNPYLDEVQTDSVRYTIVAGEAFMKDVLDPWQNKIKHSITINMYGPTENTVYATGHSFKYGQNAFEHHGGLTIGKDLKNSKSIIIDEKGNPIKSANEIGELCLSGPQLTPGYLNNKKENQEKFFFYNDERFYKTGDLCFYDENSLIMYIGRLDSQVQINGYRVELNEIESKYKSISKYSSIAIPFSNRQGNLEIALIIECDKYDYTSDIEKLKGTLPSYMCPSKILFMKRFPLNSNGKIDKRALKENFNLK
ncbi:AMP-binding protein [Marinifilum flexuosum]|uniref:AMP-binding protein n=1 Tax=Marinifilum flexuosum TaxID=1117708 RepID=UPI0024911F3A|nr:AMP-binding protein [Marinifilum flexuosum]